MKETTSEPFAILKCPKCQHMTFYILLTQTKTEVTCTQCGFIALVEKDWTQIPTLKDLAIKIDKQIRLRNKMQFWRSQDLDCPNCGHGIFMLYKETKLVTKDNIWEDAPIVRVKIECTNCRKKYTPEDLLKKVKSCTSG